MRSLLSASLGSSMLLKLGGSFYLNLLSSNLNMTLRRLILIVYDLPELYKALALAHMKSRDDEAWKIAHERLLRLVEVLENINSKLAPLDISLGYYLKGHARSILSSVEVGDAASLMAVYETIEGKIKPFKPQVEMTHFYVTTLRLLTSLIAIVSAIIIAYISYTIGAILQLTLALIAVGTGTAGLLLATHKSGHIAPLISIIIQVISLATKIEIISITSVTSLLTASITLALLNYVQIRFRKAVKTTMKKTF
ncbi:MAG: hypothetical protein P3X22_001645 [Thermoprotei archaeon]|nr:hypothetical protein [Thermoprotei archaeon]